MIKDLVGKFGALAKNVQTSLPVSKKGSKANGALPEINIANLKNVPVPIVDGVKDVFCCISDYLKVAEVEQTKRVDILAKRDIALQELKNQRGVFKQLMQFTFQERAVVLQKQLDTLDSAMASGDLDVIKAALGGMVSVIESSPFKNIQDLQIALGSKDFVVKLE